MDSTLVIVGCGGHGRESLGIARDIMTVGDRRWRILGFVDDAPSPANLERVGRLGYPYLGPLPWLKDAPTGTGYVIGIGDPRVRRAVAERLDEYPVGAVTLIHPTATIGLDTTLAEGAVLFPGSRVTTNVTVGRHMHLNQNSTVGHDCALADFVTIGPLAAVSGSCRLGPGVLIGASATVLQGLHVGDDAIVGAGACVVRDVPGGVVVKGVPAR